MKNILTLFMFSFVIMSCSNNQIFINSLKNPSVSIRFKFDKRLNLKSTSGIRARTIDDIKSYNIFLSSDFSNPTAKGANPFGDNNVLKVNSSQVVENRVVTFENIPVGGPYYAFISAYDSEISSASRNNITEVDTSLTSTDKNFSRSYNSITVNNDKTVYVSGEDSNLVVLSLKLKNELPVNIDSSVTLNDLPVPDYGVLQ